MVDILHYSTAVELEADTLANNFKQVYHTVASVLPTLVAFADPDGLFHCLLNLPQRCICTK